MEIDIEEEGDSTDGIRDTIKVVSIEIYKFLQQDIDSLDLPEIIKNCLQNFKSDYEFHPCNKTSWQELK